MPLAQSLGANFFCCCFALAFVLILIRHRFWKIYVLHILARPKNSGVNHQSGTANFVRCIIFHRAFRISMSLQKQWKRLNFNTQNRKNYHIPKNLYNSNKILRSSIVKVKKKTTVINIRQDCRNPSNQINRTENKQKNCNIYKIQYKTNRDKCL